MKGIILAGGTGSRLFPLTHVVGKQLIPIYDKPMIYYPLTTLMQAGIHEILVITTPHENWAFKKLLGKGTQFGLKISYAVQPKPQGIAQAFIIGRKFIGKDSVALILGDNIFYGDDEFTRSLKAAAARRSGATVFGYQVPDPQRYGVISFDRKGMPAELVEKPKNPKSNYIVTGLYFYDNDVVGIARKLKPSNRGELEITDVNRAYLKRGKLAVQKMERGTAWLDTGTHESMFKASVFIQTLRERQGLNVACPEEVAYKMNYITAADVAKTAQPMKNSEYGKYLLNLIDGKK